MIAKGGDRLLREDAVAAIRAELLVAGSSPRIPRGGGPVRIVHRTLADMRAARRIRTMGPRVVVVKGVTCRWTMS
jgi:hydroxymethylpyrimidine/phosphomethylpyrimidine kinase